MAESSWATVAGGHAINEIQWEQMATGFVREGIIGSPTDTPVVYGDATGMQVKVRASKLGLCGGGGWYSGTSEFTRSIGANSSGQTRIDLVVLRLTRSTRVVSIVVKAGTPGAGAPALTQDAAALGTGTWEVPVAQVTVVNGASTITAANVANVATMVAPAKPNYLRAVLNKTGTNQSLPQSLTATVQWTAVTANSSSGIWSAGTSSRFYFPVTGIYRVTFRASCNLQSGGCVSWIAMNGDLNFRYGQHPNPPGAWGTALHVDYEGAFTGGEYGEIAVLQNVSPTVTIGNTEQPQLWVQQTG